MKAMQKRTKKPTIKRKVRVIDERSDSVTVSALGKYHVTVSAEEGAVFVTVHGHPHPFQLQVTEPIHEAFEDGTPATTIGFRESECPDCLNHRVHDH